MPAIFSDHLVLQQGKTVAVWGWADPGEAVAVLFGDQSQKVVTGNDGDWKVTLKPLKANSRPAELKIQGKNEVVIRDVLVGEVWVCSGQSNMGFTVERALNARDEIAKSANPQIRMFRVPRSVADEPQKDLVTRDTQSVWLEADPKNTGEFTAAGYFMGRELQKELQVPIGLINTSWGGTRAEAWTSKSALESQPCCRPILSGWDAFLKTYDAAKDQEKHHALAQLVNAKIQKIKADNAQPGAKPQRLPRAMKPWGSQLTSQHRPSRLFNAMIAPLVPYTARGAIWYQGESNQGRAEQYQTLLPTLINDWRAHWNDEFSFYIVQLASYGNHQSQPSACGANDTWAELQWTQLQTALTLPKCGLAVANDVGNEKDIHPKNKQEVGRRLALQALAQDYGRKDIVKDGPLYATAQFRGGKCVVSFRNAEHGLQTRDGGELKGFIIAGDDKIWKPAQAKIVGDKIEVSSPEVSKPAAVRYYWQSWNPEANLVNRSGLPASLFRTDNWDLATKGANDPFEKAVVTPAVASPPAQEEATRRLSLQGTLLNLPVNNGAPQQTVRVEVAGKKVREFAVEFATKKPDFWVFVDVSPWRGKEATLRGPASAIAAIECGAAIKSREAVYAEKLRPQFHFSAQRGRLNDPNGLLYFAGEYHLFYQLHPYGVKSGSKHWGHAVSGDLVHWQELPIALYADAEGMMFSGSGVVDWKNTTGFQLGSAPPLVLIYTATGPPRSQCLAYSNDRGRTWTKYAGNPVLPEVEYNNRDPKVFWHEPTQRWVMALHCTPRGKKLPAAPTEAKKKTGTFGIFTSPDLKHWTSASRVEGFYECPDLFPMKVEGTGKTQWILHGGSGEYQVGDFDGTTFTPRTGFLRSPYGGAFYAGQNFSDMPDGRVVQIGWAHMSDVAFAGMPFSQMLNFPCELSLRPLKNGPQLAWQPVREIESLRTKRHSIAPGALDAEHSPLKDVQTEAFDLRADLEVGTAREIVLNIRGTAFTLNVATQSLVCGKASMAVPVTAGRVQFRVLSDRALVEVFADEGLKYGAFSRMPKPEAPLAPELVARGGTARIVALEVDELAFTWPVPKHPRYVPRPASESF